MRLGAAEKSAVPFYMKAEVKSMASLTRGTTPTLIFELPFDTNLKLI